MMAGKRTISIRFHEDNVEDVQLYGWLAGEAGGSVSLASMIKTKIKVAYEMEQRSKERDEFHLQIIKVIRDEFQEAGMRFANILHSVDTGNNGEIVPSYPVEGNKLPEECRDLPNGVLDFLE